MESSQRLAELIRYRRATYSENRCVLFPVVVSNMNRIRLELDLQQVLNCRIDETYILGCVRGDLHRDYNANMIRFRDDALLPMAKKHYELFQSYPAIGVCRATVRDVVVYFACAYLESEEHKALWDLNT